MLMISYHDPSTPSAVTSGSSVMLLMFMIRNGSTSPENASRPSISSARIVFSLTSLGTSIMFPTLLENIDRKSLVSAVTSTLPALTCKILDATCSVVSRMSRLPQLIRTDRGARSSRFIVFLLSFGMHPKTGTLTVVPRRVLPGVRAMPDASSGESGFSRAQFADGHVQAVSDRRSRNPRTRGDFLAGHSRYETHMEKIVISPRYVPHYLR